MIAFLIFLKYVVFSINAAGSKWMKPKKQSTPLHQVQEEEEDEGRVGDARNTSERKEVTKKNQVS